MSYNPFTPLEQKLDNIESLLVNLSQNGATINKVDRSGNNQSSTEDLIYVPEAAILLGYKESTIRTLCHQRKIPHFKKGKLLRFNRQELLNWVNSGKRKTEEELFTAALVHPTKL